MGINEISQYYSNKAKDLELPVGKMRSKEVEVIFPDDLEFVSTQFLYNDYLCNVRLPKDLDFVTVSELSRYNCKLPKHVEKIALGANEFKYAYLRGDVYLPKSLKSVEFVHFDNCIIHYEGSKQEYEKLVENSPCIESSDILSVEYNCNYTYESYEEWPRYQIVQTNGCTIYNNVLLNVSTEENNLVIPEPVRWIVQENQDEKIAKKFFRGKKVKSIQFPKTLMFIPECFVSSFPSCHISTSNLMDFENIRINEQDIESENSINAYHSNIHPKHIKSINNIVLNSNAPVLAFENENECLSNGFQTISNTNIQFIKMGPECDTLHIGFNYHIDTMILKNTSTLSFIGEECIKNLYVPLDLQFFISEVKKDSVVHIQTVHYEGNEKQWNKLINDSPLEVVGRKHAPKFKLVIDNVLFNDYSKSNEYTIDRMKEIEKEIGSNSSISNEPIIPIIKYADIEKDNKLEKQEKGTTKKISKDDYELVIPNTVKKINDYEYQNSSIRSVYIPSTCKSIGSSAFSDCKLLEKVYIEDGVKEFGKGVFEKCTLLKQIEIPSTIDIIPVDAFSECENLEDVVFRGTVSRVLSGAFRGTVIDEFVYPDGITHIDGHVFDFSEVGAVYYPKSVKIIEANACYVSGFSDYIEVEYDGTEDEWDEITIKRPNDVILNQRPQKRKKKTTKSSHRQKNVKIKVQFDDGKSYYYNCLYEVCVGDDVKVAGSKSNEIGHVIEISGKRDRKNIYLKEVLEVIIKS